MKIVIIIVISTVYAAGLAVFLDVIGVRKRIATVAEKRNT